MSAELKPTSGGSSEQETPSPLAPSRAAILQALELIRQRFHRHLDAIEGMARARAQLGNKDASEREQQLRHRLLELEHAQIQLRSETERWEHERQAMIEQLEHDRRLLAEAWERLEREQVQIANAPAEPARSAATTAVTQWPKTVTLASGRDETVAEEILRQFQSLRRDVRRNAEAGCSH